MTSISVQSVPSSVAVGPDGALYVGELTGVPFEPGTARVWRVVPGKKPTVYATGFTNISDLAFDGKNLLVLELAAKGCSLRRSPGALIRLAPGGAAHGDRERGPRRTRRAWPSATGRSTSRTTASTRDGRRPARRGRQLAA